MSSTINTRSRGRPLRSRNGWHQFSFEALNSSDHRCITCRQKKVKCDEEHPSCGRCERLGEACTWPESQQGRTSTEKRRREKESWTPKQILPNMQPTLVAGGVGSLAATAAVEPLAWSEGFGSLATTGWEEWCLGQHTTLNLDALPEDPTEFFDFEKSLDQEFSSVEDTTFYFEITASIPSSLRHIWDISNSNFGGPSPLGIMAPSFQGNRVALSPSFEFGNSERRALHHYQHFFSVGQTTKRATAWTTLGAVLSLGSSVPMVMHLLIANSLVYLANCYGCDAHLSSVAQQHFKAGAQLLVESLTGGSEPDHATTLSAFYFTYCYMTKRKEIDVQVVLQLGKAVTNHVEHYKLDVLCSGTLLSQSATGRSAQTLCLSKNNPSFLARMIMWLYYQDAIGCSMGHGGAFASYMAANENRMMGIYKMSTTALESFWGDDYPVTEIIDDVENGAVLEFLHEVWTCLQQVNQYWENPDTRIFKEGELEQRIAALDQKAQSLSRLVAISSTPGSSLLENFDFAMSYNYVLLIFHHRHKANFTKCVPQIPPCPALTPLLSIMQRTFATKYSRHNERYMWPLFLAGIETKDAIHREWIAGKIADLRMRRALEHICSVQGRTGRRVDIKLVKMILCGQVTSIMPLS